MEIINVIQPLIDEGYKQAVKYADSLSLIKNGVTRERVIDDFLVGFMNGLAHAEILSFKKTYRHPRGGSVFVRNALTPKQSTNDTER